MLPGIDRVYYINLNHRRDRNEQILEEFGQMGIPHTLYERFPAIHHTTIGGVGCARSHIAVLEDAVRCGYEQIMVFEDDFQFCVSPEQFHAAIESLQHMEYDVCMMSYHLYESAPAPASNPNFRKVLYAQTVSGYIIKRHYFQVLINCFREAANLFEQTNYHWLHAIDVMWRPLQERDNWICFTPRLGKQRPSFSDCSATFNDSDW